MSLFVMCGLLLASFGDAANFLRSGQVTEVDAQSSLDAELAIAVGDERLTQLEDALRVTYESLPKNMHGNLGHQAVRYVLHRLFVQRYGWFIRGLEPNSERAAPSTASPQEWVPSFLQGILEERVGERGANLHELAALAAALEDLVRKEAVGRLEMAYSLHGLPMTGTVLRHKVEEAVATYFVTFLLAGNFSAATSEEVNRKKSIFAQKYTGWNEAEDWLKSVQAPHVNSSNELNFAGATRLVSEIGEQYYRFNDLECRSLKNTLRDMEGRKAGRVRLSTFYKKALYSHWRFTEQADYLRVLGALDESDARQPQVIVPNYIMARPNCLEASNLYAICCQNECEALMGHLEHQLGSPTAVPGRIAELVANLPSDTVEAPRNLSAALLSRLDQVAEANWGKVPLHGRLFAQWMHHAYPRECPYPHEAGTTSPQTPDEWMKETGRSDSQASAEEMQKQVESDTCASDAPHSSCGDEAEEVELPWSEAEELLVSRPALAAMVEQPMKDAQVTRRGVRFDVLAAALLAAGLAVVLAVDYWVALRRRGKWSIEAGLAGKPRAGWRTALAFCACTLAARAIDLLDGAAFVCALGGGLLILAARSAADRLLAAHGSAMLPLHLKGCCA